ncbi:hypothetical protein INR49_014281 [Caranx melampygus]|nr:hypothetical protein INR49_014281 [Caranx melampygus]
MVSPRAFMEQVLHLVIHPPPCTDSRTLRSCWHLERIQTGQVMNNQKSCPPARAQSLCPGIDHFLGVLE